MDCIVILHLHKLWKDHENRSNVPIQSYYTDHISYVVYYIQVAYFIPVGLYLLISWTNFAYYSTSLSSRNHPFVLWIYESVLFCLLTGFVFRFHILVRSYDIFLCLTFYLAYPLDPFMLSQMARITGIQIPFKIVFLFCMENTLKWNCWILWLNWWQFYF